MKKVLVSLAAVIVLIASTVVFILFSATGLNLVLRVVSPLTDGAFTVENSGGSIAGGWWLSGLKIQSESADISVKEISMDWQLSTLLKGNVHATAVSIKEVEITVLEPGSTVKEQTASPFILPAIAIPLTIIVDKLTVDGGIVKHVDGTAPLFVMNRLSLGIRATADQLIVEEVSVKSPEFDTTLNGRVMFSKDWPLEFQGQWMVKLADYSPLSGTVKLFGTVNSPGFNISVSDPFEGSLSGTLSDIFDNLSWQVKAAAESLNPQNISLQWPVLEIDATLQAGGTIDDYSGRISTVVEVDEFAPPAVDVKFSGSQSNLSIEPATMTIADSEMTVTALVDWQNNLSWQLKGTVDGLNPQNISPSWPLLDVDGNFDSAGTIDDYHGRLSAVIEVDEYTQPAVDVKFSGNQSNLSIEPATVIFGEGETTVAGLVDWQNDLSWRLLAEINEVKLSAIDPQLDGLLSLSASSYGTYGKNLLYHLQVSDFVGAFEALNQHVLGELTLDGDESGLEVLSSEFAIGTGHVEIAGTVNWQDMISWETRVQLKSFDPSVIETAIKGSVNAELKSHGTASDGTLNGEIELSNVSGLLAGYELSGGGIIDYADGNITIENLFLENGKNHLAVDGRIAQVLDLSFSLQGPELNRIVPSLGGMIRANGKVSGSKEFPALSAKINADTLSYGDYSVGSIVSEIAVSTGGDGEVQTSIEGGAINVAGHHIDQLTVELAGSMEKHNLEVHIDSEFGKLQLATNGRLSDRKLWQGEVKTFRMEHPRFGLWQNSTVSKLRVSAESADLKDLCISSERVELCSEGSWQGPAGWSFNARELNVDLAVLNDWSILTTPTVTGTVKGAVSGSGDGTQLSSLRAEFALDELLLGLEKNEYYQELKWLDTAVSIKLDNKLLETGLYSRFVDDSFIKATIGINGVDDLSASFTDLPVAGNLQAVINDMNPLKVLTGGYLEPTGRLSADLDLSGSIADPRVLGNIDLADGKIHIPQLNITPNNINASINGDAESILVKLEALSGDGNATAEGEFHFDNDSWLGTLKIVGENVDLLKQKELEITATPDLLLTLGADGGRLEGTLSIPRALIQPEEMTGSESESDDVMIMGQESGTGSWPFNLAVKIELGEDVTVDGYGLSGNLRGSLDLANTKSSFLAGRGIDLGANSQSGVKPRTLALAPTLTLTLTLALTLTLTLTLALTLALTLFRSPPTPSPPAPSPPLPPTTSSPPRPRTPPPRSAPCRSPPPR